MEKGFTITTTMDYSENLRSYGIEYRPANPYWQVGNIEKIQGWILHISVVLPQLPAMLELIIPRLATMQVAFKIVMTEEMAKLMLEGSLGYIQLGKLISIYPTNDAMANTIAQEIIKLTDGFLSPAIPTDRHLGSVVYTRYGSFNPVLLDRGTGALTRCIYNSAGQLMADPYDIPFALPDGISWPFEKIASPHVPPRPKLMNMRYYLLRVIKPDVKGRVIHALYFKKPWQIMSCIIKEGNPYMFMDKSGRDIRNRLKWQHDLYMSLHGDVPLPKVFDYFVTDDTVYLVMERINGVSLTTWVDQLYCHCIWRNLSQEEKLDLLEKFLNILDIMSRLHRRGYIHRDITPDNFIVDKKGRLFLIDMELAWSAIDRYPNPPFGLGTLGHISPEQQDLQTPTVKEDIYGLGATLIMLLTNLHALKFEKHSPSEVGEALLLFTGDLILADLVVSCLQKEPDNRPGLQNLQASLKVWSGSLATAVNPLKHREIKLIGFEELEDLVQQGITGIAGPEFVNPKQIFVSLTSEQETHIGNEQMGLTLSEGWHSGMTGTLWFIACAKQRGYSVDTCKQAYVNSWEHLRKHFIEQVQHKAPGLYHGAAGVAMALIEGLKAGLLTPDESTRSGLQSCFSRKSSGLCLATGIAGQGIALLNTVSWLENDFIKNTLAEYVTEILSHQLPNGAWQTSKSSVNRKNVITGLDFGVAGIIWFLLCYCRHYQDERIAHATKKALAWLAALCKKKNDQYSWPFSVKSKAHELWQPGIGMPGIALCFMRAYELWKDPKHKLLVEKALLSLPAEPSAMDWSLATGLAGLAEVYMEAQRVFQSHEWEKRANWIVNMLAKTAIRSEKGFHYWLVGYNSTKTMDLFTGNAGILHCCMRNANIRNFTHPLSA